MVLRVATFADMAMQTKKLIKNLFTKKYIQ